MLALLVQLVHTEGKTNVSDDASFQKMMLLDLPLGRKQVTNRKDKNRVERMRDVSKKKYKSKDIEKPPEQK